MNRVLLLLALIRLSFISGCSDDTGPEVDALPPGAVADLHASALDADHVLLTWTAPGDDAGEGRASHYDVRYSPSPRTTQEWSIAPPVASPPVPKPPGEAESLGVSAAGAREWYFTLRTADETFNWSLISNVAYARSDDPGPPAVVVDLEVVATTLRSVTLAWTASGDDGHTGTAAEYDLRVAESPITSQNWADAERLSAPAPSAAGARDSVTVGGLTAARSYYFALIVGDEFSRWSPLSNVASGVPGLRRLTYSPELSVFGARHACWSPDGTALVFDADWDDAENLDLYLIPAAGGTAVRMTDWTGADQQPAWSSAHRIAFTSNHDGRDEIWTMDDHPGAIPERHAAFDGDAFDPTWSPDGVALAYIVRTSVTSTAVYLDSLGSGASGYFYSHSSEHSDPAWCPDSVNHPLNPILFTSNRTGSVSIWRLFAVSGFEEQAVQLSFAEETDAAPSWSPFGDRFAFHSERSGNADIWIMPENGASRVQLTFDPSTDSHPAWSPDGSFIAFTSRRSGKPEIWVQQME